MAKVILVVDDDDNLRRMTSRLLTSRDYAALTAPDTEAALKALASGQVDAVLLDVVLGRENGWDALRRIRESSAVPVLMMSGATMDEDSGRDAAAMGAQGVLQKPFEPRTLFSSLAELFSVPPAAP